MENSVTNELDVLFNELIVSKITKKMDDSISTAVNELKQIAEQNGSMSSESAVKELEQCLEDVLSNGNMEISFGAYVDLQFGMLNKKLDECKNECKICEEKVSEVTSDLGDKIAALQQFGRKLDQIMPQVSALIEDEKKLIAEGNEDLCKKLDYANSLEKASIMRNGENLSALKEEMEKFYTTSLPEITVASYRAEVDGWTSLMGLCPEVIGPEMAKAGCTCPEPGYCYVIDHDE